LGAHKIIGATQGVMLPFSTYFLWNLHHYN
jgi:hypothetical protein